MNDMTQPVVRRSIADIDALFALPFADLMFRAQTVHRENFDPNKVQLSTLLSIKTGGCPEDCAYCPQSARYDTGVENQSLLNLDDVLAAAKAAKAARRHALLHGRGVARAEATRPRARARRWCARSRRWAWKPAPRWAC